MSHGSSSLAGRKPLLQRLKRDITTNWQIYIMLIPAVIAIIMFAYVPMYGVQMAFKDFKPIKGIWGSEWVGFAHFQRFFKGHQFIGLCVLRRDARDMHHRVHITEVLIEKVIDRKSVV